ncbi:Zinc (Zn2)-Iron (Fe2) Permease (ZIP) Family [Thraustotheca clavata]|uniref:Zinc (Zn2)-Iron (Fe2) Permease (ZIP) Family n=1 Tax=Thraustotheca clavata TaxID=74557 RepID=A0A1V9ZSK6_9STRA|nr:Zinc (Zn2)-Iron (Fe2) Permease (ZIP) Family [Thraustotheca clavata]
MSSDFPSPFQSGHGVLTTLSCYANAIRSFLNWIMNNASCGAPLEKGEYNTKLHIISIFVLFSFSLLGSMVPVLSSYLMCLRRSRKFIEFVNSFGFGVIIATTFVHIIPPAFIALNDPCLELRYNSIAMVIIVITIFIMQLLETELMIAMTEHAEKHSDFTSFDDPPLLMPKGNDIDSSRNINGIGHIEQAHISADSAALRKKISVALFEIGIAVHSVIIGVELGVTDGSTFTTLWIALCFHQFFEGIAVGTSAVSAFSGLRASVGTSVIYSLTTPLGIVIGILVSSSYSPTSPSSLWVRGTMEAIAGGILVYAGIVELMTYQCTINAEFHAKSKSKRIAHYMSFYLGAIVMICIGYFN